MNAPDGSSLGRGHFGEKGRPGRSRPGAKAHDYFAAVRAGKNYISLYLLVADTYPDALVGTTDALLRRRSGKAAFTFPRLDDGRPDDRLRQRPGRQRGDLCDERHGTAATRVTEVPADDVDPAWAQATGASLGRPRANSSRPRAAGMIG